MSKNQLLSDLQKSQSALLLKVADLSSRYLRANWLQSAVEESGRSASCAPYVEYAVVRPNVLGDADPRHPDEGCFRLLGEREWAALLDAEGRVSNPLHFCKACC